MTSVSPLHLSPEGDKIFREIIVLKVFDRIFEGKNGDPSHLSKVNDAVECLLSGIIIGIKRNRTLSADLVRDVASEAKRKQEVKLLANKLAYLLLAGASVFEEDRTGKEVYNMLWVAQGEVLNRFRLGGFIPKEG